MNQVAFTFIRKHNDFTRIDQYIYIYIQILNVIEWLQMIQQEIPTLDNAGSSLLAKASFRTQLAASTLIFKSYKPKTPKNKSEFILVTRALKLVMLRNMNTWAIPKFTLYILLLLSIQPKLNQLMTCMSLNKFNLKILD